MIIHYSWWYDPSLILSLFIKIWEVFKYVIAVDGEGACEGGGVVILFQWWVSFRDASLGIIVLFYGDVGLFIGGPFRGPFFSFS